MLIILLLIAIPISLLFLIAGLQSMSPLLLIGAIFLLTITACLGFLFNYGIIVFGDFSLGRASVFTRFLTVRLKTSAKYTEECIEKLSHIKKIETFNNYKKEKK